MPALAGSGAHSVARPSNRGNRIAIAGGAAAVGLGLFVLTGWSFGLVELLWPVPRMAAMQPITAVLFVLSGTTLLFTSRPSLPDLPRLLVATAVLVISVLTLVQYVFSIDLGMDRLLFREAIKAQAVRVPYPGRMAETTAASFALIAICLLIARARSKATSSLYIACATLVALIASFVLLDYIFRYDALADIFRSLHVALLTAIGLEFLAIGLIVLRPQRALLQLELKQTRELLEAVVENMPDTMVLRKLVGDELYFTFVNTAGEKLLGRKREEMIGKADGELFPPDEAEAIRAPAIMAVQTKRIQVASRVFTGPSGPRTLESRIVPIADENGEITQVLSIARDITEEHAREERIRQLQRLESVGQLTGGVAHDFNNLLAVIMGNVELVQEALPVGSETILLADEAINATHRGADLVRRLLAFARRQKLDPTAVDLNSRVSQMTPLLQRTLGENVEVNFQPAETLWLATVDPTQVDDALLNLAINARDAMPGGGRLTIETRNVTLDEDYAEQHIEVVPGDYVQLSVSDTGTGMAPEVASRVFEPFFTTKEEGKGTGLGLSQVFGWVKQSGGHIKIYTELGVGTTVKLYLPRADTVTSEETLRDDIRPSRGTEIVLVVEDNPTVRTTVVRQLSSLGYTSITAANGNEALRLVAEETEFDLILTDVVMPGGMSGFDLAEEVERLRPGTKVLFTSGYTQLATNGRAEHEGKTLITKPYTKSELGRAIRTVLDER